MFLGSWTLKLYFVNHDLDFKLLLSLLLRFLYDTAIIKILATSLSLRFLYDTGIIEILATSFPGYGMMLPCLVDHVIPEETSMDYT